FAVYELVFQANTLFHHSNLRLPIRLERILNKVLVTPRMHGIHHSQVRRETNSNYGVVFPWWDRVHRTLGLNIPQAEIAIGIPGYSQPGDNRHGNALLMPFRKQRDYWRRTDGTLVERAAPVCRQSSSYLAEKFCPAMIAVDRPRVFVRGNSRAYGKTSWYPDAARQSNKISVKIAAVPGARVTCINRIAAAPAFS